MNDSEAIQRKLIELDVKLDLLTKRILAYVTTILQILHNPATRLAGRQGVVGFREMLHYLNQNEKDFFRHKAWRTRQVVWRAKTPTSVDREFIRLMKPLWLDPEWGNGPLTD